MSQIDTAPSAAELAALLCSRVCHDIAGPTSAMGAALSVLDDEGAADMRDDAIDLLRTGAVSIRNKLEYARVCFGAAGSRGGEMTVEEIRAVAEPMFADARPDLVFKTEAGALDKSAGRVLLNLIWMAVESLPRGGTVTVEAASSTDGGARLRIIAAGPRIRLEPAYAAALGGERPEDGYDGRSIQAYYAGLIAREAGGRAAASATEDRAEFTALTGPAQSIAAAE
jgi:histidine phosphotransferase ChpT